MFTTVAVAEAPRSLRWLGEAVRRPGSVHHADHVVEGRDESLELGPPFKRPVARYQDSQRDSHPLGRADLMPDEPWLLRKLGDEAVGELAGTRAPLPKTSLPAASCLQVTASWPGAGRRVRLRLQAGPRVVAPEQRDGELGASGHTIQGGAELNAARGE